MVPICAAAAWRPARPPARGRDTPRARRGSLTRWAERSCRRRSSGPFHCAPPSARRSGEGHEDCRTCCRRFMFGQEVGAARDEHRVIGRRGEQVRRFAHGAAASVWNAAVLIIVLISRGGLSLRRGAPPHAWLKAVPLVAVAYAPELTPALVCSARVALRARACGHGRGRFLSSMRSHLHLPTAAGRAASPPRNDGEVVGPTARRLPAAFACSALMIFSGVMGTSSIRRDRVVHRVATAGITGSRVTLPHFLRAEGTRGSDARRAR